jgi:hypothetical protein
MIFSHLVLIVIVICVTTLILSFIFWHYFKRHRGVPTGAVSNLASSLRDEKAKADIIVNTIEPMKTRSTHSTVFLMSLSQCATTPHFL